MNTFRTAKGYVLMILPLVIVILGIFLLVENSDYYYAASQSLQNPALRYCARKLEP
jgi:hypothetical protein